MRRQGTNARDVVVGRVADRQFGVVTHWQLLAAGLSARTIMRAVEAGRLRPLLRGVYAVGHVQLRREGWWMAALLACGEASVLSHGSAAALWGLRSGGVGPVEVIAVGGGGRKRKGIRARRMALAGDEVVVCDRLRVTTPARTIVDLAATLPPRPLREAVERAQDRRRFDPKAVARTIERAPRRKGSASLIALITLLSPDTDRARSELERRFLRICRRAKLPLPQVNYEIAGHKRDFVWPGARLVVETDGYAYHSSRAAFTEDRRRDRELTALGWRPARYTYEEVALDPELVATSLRVLLAEMVRLGSVA